MKRQPDILDEMTKPELVAWIREHCFSRPRRSEMLWVRWQIQSEQLLRDSKQETDRFRKIDFKPRDKLARQFNASTDIDEKVALAQQIKVYDKQFCDHIRASQAHDRRQKRIDRLYEQIEVARRGERS